MQRSAGRTSDRKLRIQPLVSAPGGDRHHALRHLWCMHQAFGACDLSCLKDHAKPVHPEGCMLSVPLSNLLGHDFLPPFKLLQNHPAEYHKKTGKEWIAEPENALPLAGVIVPGALAVLLVRQTMHPSPKLRRLAQDPRRTRSPTLSYTPTKTGTNLTIRCLDPSLSGLRESSPDCSCPISSFKQSRTTAEVRTRESRSSEQSETTSRGMTLIGSRRISRSCGTFRLKTRPTDVARRPQLPTLKTRSRRRQPPRRAMPNRRFRRRRRIDVRATSL
ncbi:hypothetical protein BJ166DRAFT_619278 [Pestalotiopsis sp. NC0098]|nr:hypothetical protein BJ166DRAFT_619278 [Pestalotiopsis sp. NC0098]